MADSELISVQELVKAEIQEIPQEYVVDQEHAFQSEMCVPIIDMKKFFSCGKAKARELQKFHSACKEWGIFQVFKNYYVVEISGTCVQYCWLHLQLVNHGVDGSWVLRTAIGGEAEI